MFGARNEAVRRSTTKPASKLSTQPKTEAPAAQTGSRPATAQPSATAGTDKKEEEKAGGGGTNVAGMAAMFNRMGTERARASTITTGGAAKPAPVASKKEPPRTATAPV